jgi:hypothetical protein
MIKILKLKFWRNFSVIDNFTASQLGLAPYRNIYGDEINHLNCRSIWADAAGRLWRVKYLY